MENSIIVALIGFAATVIAAIIGTRATSSRQSDFRQSGLPNNTVQNFQHSDRPSPARIRTNYSDQDTCPDGTETVRIFGFSFDQRKPRELDLSLVGQQLIFHQHPPGKEYSGDRVRVSLVEVQRILADGDFVVPDVGGAKSLRFRLSTDPDEPNEFALGEMVVDGGKWWISIRIADLQAALLRFGVQVQWV